jgi:hypothetical protein
MHKNAQNMHKRCIKYAENMHKICRKYAENMQVYAQNMLKYAIKKYARICTNMHKICNKYATNMQRYAMSVNIDLLWEYARNMHKICRNMQYMQSWILYAEYARICTPHFADETWSGWEGSDHASHGANGRTGTRIWHEPDHRRAGLIVQSGRTFFLAKTGRGRTMFFSPTLARAEWLGWPPLAHGRPGFELWGGRWGLKIN